jgi:hypothetical protein
LHGATTLGIIALRITTLCIIILSMTKLSTMTLSTVPLSITRPSIRDLIAIFSRTIF